MEKNNRWFIQIPCSLEGKNAPKYEYLSASYKNMRIEAPEKKIFCTIESYIREEAEEILKEVKKSKINYDSSTFLGEKFKKTIRYFDQENTILSYDEFISGKYRAHAILIDSNFVFSKELSLCGFDNRYEKNSHIFYGDQYIGTNPFDFLKLKNFKIDFLVDTFSAWKNIGPKKAIKFSKETISEDLEEEIFKKIEKNIQKTPLKFLNIEKRHIKLLKYNNKIFLYINIHVDKKEKMNIYESHCRVFIFELDEFLKNGSIVERDLDDDFIKIRSQISHLSLGRHDSIAF